MSKSKYSTEFKIKISEEYLLGEKSSTEIAKEYNVSDVTVLRWAKKYEKYSSEVFIQRKGNKEYTKEFKEKCVKKYLNNEYSLDDIVLEYGISSNTVLRKWINCYNANEELKDYNPKQEVYMAQARRKTTLDERKEITEYCISHNYDYKNTAEKFSVSYSQVYSWVRKYNEKGEEGLIDKRGYHKSDDEVDELERLRRENTRLKKRLEEQEMAVELLKKVKEFERM